MPRPVTTNARANHKPARLPAAALDALLDAIGEDALSPAELRSLLPGRTLRQIDRRPQPTLLRFHPLDFAKDRPAKRGRDALMASDGSEG